MGRTIASYRVMLEKEVKRWEPFKESLSPNLAESFDKLWMNARKLSHAGGMALRPVIFDAVLFSMLLMLQNELYTLTKRLETLVKEEKEKLGIHIISY